MAFTQIVIGWVAVTAWLIAWRLPRRWLRKTDGWLPAPMGLFIGEALWLTLLGALWFGSLGHGQWWLPFTLVGLLMEWSVAWSAPTSPAAPAREPPLTDARKRSAAALVGGVVRVIGAGALLAWILS